MKDLILLVADKSMEKAIQGGLSRPISLGISPIAFDFLQHPGRDGGTRTSGSQILSLEKNRYRHALLVLDHEGSGSDQSAVELEEKLDNELQNVWGHDAKAIVIAPELDVWMWGSDNSLADILRWPEPKPIREWLAAKGFALDTEGKPLRPKEALEAIFPICKLPRSSAIYEKIAANISLSRCRDSSFLRLKATLQSWFPLVNE